MTFCSKTRSSGPGPRRTRCTTWSAPVVFSASTTRRWWARATRWWSRRWTTRVPVNSSTGNCTSRSWTCWTDSSSADCGPGSFSWETRSYSNPERYVSSWRGWAPHCRPCCITSVRCQFPYVDRLSDRSHKVRVKQ
jgi:hypothetical protein